MRVRSFGQLSAKRPDETIIVGFDWFDLIANFWEAGTEYEDGAFIRPRRFTGFAYQRVGSGQSGNAEPNWPRSISAMVADGNGAWAAVTGGANGITVPSGPVVAVSPVTVPPLVLGSASLVTHKAAPSRVNCTVSGGLHDTLYYITCQVTVGAETLKGTVILPVDDQV